jgi:hypothetical protein
MDTAKLRPDTAALWARLHGHPLLKGFILIGGTALTIRIGHRVSEDLDFAYPDKQLPHAQLKAFLRSMGHQGISFAPNQDPLDEEYFLNSGLELANYQQNYLVERTVKVTFVALEKQAASVLRHDQDAPLRVASLDEIFAMKCLVCAERNKSRDWFDLYVLMRHHGYGARDFYDVFLRVDARPKYEIASTRLRTCRRLQGDEGFEQLLDSAPSDDDMRQFFIEAFDRVESELAAEAFRAKAINPMPRQ